MGYSVCFPPGLGAQEERAVIDAYHEIPARATRVGNESTNIRYGFDFNNWYQFLMIIRYLAKNLHVDARDIERSLFLAHRAYQAGTLYRAQGLKNRLQR